MRRLLAAVVALAGCGDNVTGTPFELFYAEEDTARCDYFTRCGLFADRAACEGFFRRQHDASVAGAVEAGNLVLPRGGVTPTRATIAPSACDFVVRPSLRSCDGLEALDFGVHSSGKHVAPHPKVTAQRPVRRLDTAPRRRLVAFE